MFVAAAGRRRAASAVARQRSRRLRNLFGRCRQTTILHWLFIARSRRFPHCPAGSSRCVRRPIVTRTNVRADGRRKRRRSQICAGMPAPCNSDAALGHASAWVGGTCYQPDRANCRPQGHIPLPCRGDAAASVGEEPPGLRAAHPRRQDREPRGVDQLSARIPRARNPGLVHLSAQRRCRHRVRPPSLVEARSRAGARRPAGAGGDRGGRYRRPDQLCAGGDASTATPPSCW